VSSSEGANSFGNTEGDYRSQIATVCNAREWTTLVDGSILLTTSDLSDGVHPTTAGHAKYAKRIAPILVSPSYTVSGPSNGLVSQASTDFTVNLGSSAPFLGDQTITISDGGNGGTFTPSVGSPGTSSVTVTPATSATSFTFTYTPASSGTKTFTFTNTQSGWSDPNNITYDCIVLDTTPPIGTITFGAGATYWTTNTSPTIGLDVPLVDAVQYQLCLNSADAGVDCTSVARAWDTYTASPNVYNFNGQGIKTLYVQFKDSIGNISATYFDSVIIDSIFPTITIANPSTEWTAGKTITTVMDEEGTLEMSNTTGSTCDGTLTFVAYASQTFTNSSDNGTKVCYKAVDIAGNITYAMSANIAGITTGSAGGSALLIPTPLTPSVPPIPLFDPSNPASVKIEIQRLQTLIADLMAQIKTILASRQSQYVFTKNLQLGMIDPEVQLLQQYLNTHGFILATSGAGSPGHETTIFGALTQFGLIKFQKANNITPAVGYFGPITKAKMNELNQQR
jgi:hypothetical protein